MDKLSNFGVVLESVLNHNPSAHELQEEDREREREKEREIEREKEREGERQNERECETGRGDEEIKKE